LNKKYKYPGGNNLLKSLKREMKMIEILFNYFSINNTFYIEIRTLKIIKNDSKKNKNNAKYIIHFYRFINKY